MPARLRQSLFTFLIYLAFFASGAASLIAEVTWNRMLIVVVGNSLNATAMVIVIFMGGLGLGSWIGGRAFSRRQVSLRPYFLLEAAIGLYVLASPVLFDLLTSMFAGLAETVDHRTLLTVVRLAVTMLALLLPATLMGATFPAMVSGTAQSDAFRRTARTGYLYSLNTLGAALGCFAAGYHLLLELGVQMTLNIAMGMYALAALGGLLANFLRGPAGGAAEEPAVPAAEGPGAIPVRFLAVATFLIGFVSLAYQVLLTRISILYLGNSISVFPLVLTAFLLGTGFSAVAGTWLFGALQRAGRGSQRLFGILSVAAGALIIAAPYILLSDLITGKGHFLQIADAAPRNPLPILAVLIGPTIFIGALLPVAIRILNARAAGDNTRAAANFYSLNTAGGLIGAGIANHLLVPVVGMQGTLLLLTGLCLLIGLWNLLDPRGGTRRLPAAAAAGLGLALVLFFALPHLTIMYAEKIANSTDAAEADIRLVHEGRAATVTVLDIKDQRMGQYRDMFLNGVEEASTRYWHVQLFKLLGMLPAVTHERQEDLDAMVIAFGAGITAGSVLASPAVRSLDVVDLNPDIEGINDLFTEVNGDVFHDPRFHFANDDGRNYLVTSHKKYDLIVSDSTHPRAYDSWILYTEEFYESVKQRLAPDGIFAQWVPVLGSMRGQLFRIHLNTFRTVFPTATYWYVYGSDQAFLMATPESYRLDAPTIQARLDLLPDWFKAEHYQIDTVTHLAGFFWLDEAAMTRMIGPESRINRDHLHYFDKQSAVFPLPPQFQAPMFQTSILPHLSGGDAALAEAVRREQRTARRLGNFAYYVNTDELHRAWCEDPGNGNAVYWMERAFQGELPEAASFCVDVELESYRALLEQHPDNSQALNAVADILAGAGRLTEAREYARRALDLAPDDGPVLDTYGWILVLTGDTAEGIAYLEKSLAALPGHPIVLYHLGAAHQRAGNAAEARDFLDRALARESELPYAAEARDLREKLGNR
ncbi:fused MFS/spermidine synthase [bacterium]|nr:fused MFS/spermidine synthase [bacterium]